MTSSMQYFKQDYLDYIEGRRPPPLLGRPERADEWRRPQSRMKLSDVSGRADRTR